MATTLHPGAEVRIYRDGTEIQPGVLIAPVDHHLEIRHLFPGSYLARDGFGNEVPFVVTAQEEAVVLKVSRLSADSSRAVGPGGSLVDPAPAAESGPEMIFPEVSFAEAPRADVEADVPVPAEPGSSLVESAEPPAEPVLPGESPEEGQAEGAEEPPERLEPSVDATQDTTLQATRTARDELAE